MGEETLPCWGVACPNLGYARTKISADNYEESAFKTLDLALILINLVADIKVLGKCSMTPPLY